MADLPTPPEPRTINLYSLLRTVIFSPHSAQNLERGTFLLHLGHLTLPIGTSAGAV